MNRRRRSWLVFWACAGLLHCGHDGADGAGDAGYGVADAVDPQDGDGSGDADDADGDGRALPTAEVRYTEERAPCAERNPLRDAYFGDLHVHTRHSFDAYVGDVRATPDEAYRFARGDSVRVAPLDADGVGTQVVTIDRPLDFMAVTDHGEYIGEVTSCTYEGEPGYDTDRCDDYRGGEFHQFLLWGTQLVSTEPIYLPGLCDEPGVDCGAIRREAWSEVIAAAERHYDRSDECALTTFIGYEWTGNTDGRNHHRNVIFRGDVVPDRAISYFEASTAEALWRALEGECLDAGTGCEVLAIPHNSNISNGGMFSPIYPGAGDLDGERDLAERRARLEPLVEIFQHKGASECVSGISGVFGPPDELCDFEQVRADLDDCGDDIGTFGINNLGCTSRYDFVRNALVSGLREASRLGVNPIRMGFIGSTDTHNGTPGAVSETGWLGHVGSNEALPERRLEVVGRLTYGIPSNPGGLAGVWAVENSRDAIFEALARRETFATTGPRITPRFFGGHGVPEDICDRSDLIEEGYRRGVPMGGVLDNTTGRPTFVVAAMRDPAGLPLARIDIVKGWVGPEGELRYDVFEAGSSGGEATVDLDTCEPAGEGADDLCVRWQDPDFDPDVPAFYYARVVENPSCRWSWRECLTLPEDDRPNGCRSSRFAKVINELAWTSPIWVEPVD